MNKQRIDWTKPIQTVEGGKAKFLHKMVNCKHHLPYVVVATAKDGKEEFIILCDEYGKQDFGCEHPYQIINAPPPMTKAWINLYLYGPSLYVYATKEIALARGNDKLLATVEIEVPINIHIVRE